MKWNGKMCPLWQQLPHFSVPPEGPTPSRRKFTWTPRSPSATTSLGGKQLPPPPPKFGGVIKESAKDSTPWWPPRVVPPKGAPNVLLIMTDDQGYGVSGTFGGVIPTPALDRIAKAGLRYTQFHSTALCSPTRAAHPQRERLRYVVVWQESQHTKLPIQQRGWSFRTMAFRHGLPVFLWVHGRRDRPVDAVSVP